VVEKLLHLGQHRKLGWGPIQDRIFQLEIEAQDKLLKIGRKLGWTQDELRAFAVNRSRWKELAGIE
jgi:Ser/Thr protein kinase RdoA (MazF antagonist)